VKLVQTIKEFKEKVLRLKMGQLKLKARNEEEEVLKELVKKVAPPPFIFT
jgi:hypothetical protein